MRATTDAQSQTLPHTLAQTLAQTEETSQQYTSKEYDLSCSQEEAEVRAAFGRAIAYLRELPAIEARFVQYSELGVVQEGNFLLYPPYRMRLDYDAPSGLRLYVNAQEAMHVDTKRRFVRRYPLFSLPAVRMLQRIFSGKAVDSLLATRICTLSDPVADPINDLNGTGKHYEYLRVKFRKKKRQNRKESLTEDSRGYAELYFSYRPNYSFIGWDLHSSGAGTTRIRLARMSVIDEPKISTFRFTNPWRKKEDSR